jgi:hypothetical protein
MQLAYAISGYRLPGQFRWLWSAIADPRDVFAIHIDRKTPEPVHAAFRAVTGGAPNALWVERENVVWMGQGLIRAWLRSIELLLRAAPGFDYLVNLSMQDYPLLPRAAIVEALGACPGASYVTCRPLAELPFHIRRRPWFLAFEGRERMIRTPIPCPVPRALEILWKGSWWHVLPRPFCEWLLRDPKPQRYLRFLAHVQAPDELLVQNVLMDSPFRDTLADRNRHCVLWSGASGSPLTLTMAHHDQLIGSGMWWARKLDETVDRRLLETLAARIGAAVPPAGEIAA